MEQPRESEPTGAGRLGQRAGWSLLDQALSSVSNFALVIVVARTSELASIGSFSVAYTIYFLSLSVIRALTAEPLVIRFSGAIGVDVRGAARSAVALGLVLGGVLGVALAGVGIVTGGALGGCLSALGLVLPALMVQDVCRFAFVAERAPQRACWNDGTWLLLQLSGVGVWLIIGHPSAGQQVLTWGLAGAAAAVLGLWQLRLVPRLADAQVWFRRHRDLGLPFASEVLIDRGSSQIGLALVGATGGLAALGTLTAARGLFAPVTTVTSALMTFAVAEGARVHQSGRLSLVRLALILGTGIALIPISLGAALYFGPPAVGRVLLGNSWDDARSVLVPMTIFSTAAAASVGPRAVLRIDQQARATFVAKALIAPVSVAGPVVGVAVGGTSGAANGLAISGVIAVTLWLASVLRSAGGRRPRHQPAGPGVRRDSHRQPARKARHARRRWNGWCRKARQRQDRRPRHARGRRGSAR